MRLPTAMIQYICTTVTRALCESRELAARLPWAKPGKTVRQSRVAGCACLGCLESSSWSIFCEEIRRRHVGSGVLETSRQCRVHLFL
jgi:hypothetical protein